MVMKVETTMLGFCAALSGCATSPSISVLGAFFPSWMFCIVGATATTSIIHLILRGRDQNGEGTWSRSPLAYGALTVLLALGSWILFFKN